MTYLLWTDFETTGLEESDVVLECAWALTHRDLTPVMAAVPRHFVMLHHDVEALREEADPIVRDMHDATGLWDDVATHGLWSLPSVDLEVRDWLRRAMEADGHPGAEVALAGSGVGHFDHPLIDRVLPRVGDCLTYWDLDMGVVRRYLRDIVGFAIPDMVDAQANQHRAAADMMRALNEARVYRDMLREHLPPTVQITNSGDLSSLAR